MADGSLNYYVARGTAAARAAFTPSHATPGAGPSPSAYWYETDTGRFYCWDGAAWDLVSNGGSVTVVPGTCFARLTTESGVPVSTSDRTAQATIYFTPYGGNLVAYYTGAAWVYHTQTEISLALSGLTSGLPYDVFADYNGGTPQLVLVAWTNDTTRATALTTQDGVYVKSGDTDHLYVGTIYTTATTTTEDSAAKRYVWNMYNRVEREMQAALETTDTWSYTLVAFRQVNANAAIQLDYVVGINDMPVEATNLNIASNSGASTFSSGVGVNSTSVNSARHAGAAASSSVIPVYAVYRGKPGVGRNYLAGLESSTASGTTTWRGDAGLADNRLQSGITGKLWN